MTDQILILGYAISMFCLSTYLAQFIRRTKRTNHELLYTRVKPSTEDRSILLKIGLATLIITTTLSLIHHRTTLHHHLTTIQTLYKSRN